MKFGTYYFCEECESCVLRAESLGGKVWRDFWNFIFENFGGAREVGEAIPTTCVCVCVWLLAVVRVFCVVW